MTENLPAETGGSAASLAAEKKDIRSYLVGSTFAAEAMKLLGEARLAERFARVCLTSVNADAEGELIKCTVQSLAGCFLSLAEIGLEPGRDAYLIPRGGICTTIIKWQGYIRAARASGEIKRVWSDVIRMNDIYSITGGSTVPHVEHSWVLGKERGEIIGAYACAEWMDGVIETCVYGRDYLDRCRASSDGGKAWKQWYDQMAKKSVVKRLLEGLPLGNADALTRVSQIDNASTDPEFSVVENAGGGDGTRADELRSAVRARIEGRADEPPPPAQELAPEEPNEPTPAPKPAPKRGTGRKSRASSAPRDLDEPPADWEPST